MNPSHTLLTSQSNITSTNATHISEITCIHTMPQTPSSSPIHNTHHPKSPKNEETEGYFVPSFPTIIIIPWAGMGSFPTRHTCRINLQRCNPWSCRGTTTNTNAQQLLHHCNPNLWSLPCSALLCKPHEQEKEVCMCVLSLPRLNQSLGKLFSLWVCGQRLLLPYCMKRHYYSTQFKACFSSMAGKRFPP